MKKWFIRLGIVAAVIFLIGMVSETLDYQTVEHRIRNEELTTIKPDWSGNAVDQSSRFMDERNPFLPSTLNLLKWKLSENSFKEEKLNDAWQIEVKDPSEFLAGNADGGSPWRRFFDILADPELFYFRFLYASFR